jgi:hypothetical protein
MEPGHYRLYADIVHANGFPETSVADINVPAALPARPLAGDDASGAAPAWQTADLTSNNFLLPDDYTMLWKRPPGVLHPNKMQEFRFVLLDPHGQTPNDMRLYMGMLGHAAFVATDGSAFAHIHPSGSVSMASLMMAQGQLPNAKSDADINMSQMDHRSMSASTGGVPSEVAFPYGFPRAGRYRIIVQMKRGDTVETGIFDADVR